MNQYVLITGCTSGIGLSLAKEFAIKGHNIVLVARNKEKLELLLDELKQIKQSLHVIKFFDQNFFSKKFGREWGNAP